MLTLKSSRHICTSRNIKGFRSCQPPAESPAHLDEHRLAREEERLAAREARRVWLAEQWDKHFDRAAGPLRVLPPSACSRQTRTR